MTLPTLVSFPTQPALERVGAEGGVGETKAEYAAFGFEMQILDTNIFCDSDWCEHCGKVTTFLESLRVDEGRLRSCQGCGEERLMGWTRTNSEGV